MKYLFILNDPPYGTERSYNGLRLARDMLKDPKHLHVYCYALRAPAGGQR